MNNQDQSFLDDIQKADPAYKFGKEYLAGLGIDIETSQPMMARTPNYDPAVMERLGIPIQGQVSQSEQYSEPAGPPSPFNKFGQPGEGLGLYRRLANTAARFGGRVAQGMAFQMGMTAPNLQQGAYEIGEGATRGALTQAVPGIAEIPQKVVRWGEDMTGLASMGMVEIMRTMADMAAKKGDAVGAQEFYDQARELENSTPDKLHTASETMEKALGKVVNTPQSEGEQAWRDAFSLIGSMLLTKNVGPTVGKDAPRAAKLIENAVRGGITDFVVTDPRRSSSVEGVLEMLSPAMADKARNYVSTGGKAEEEDLNLHLARRFGEVGFGALTGTILDSVMGGFKGMRLSRIADDWRGTKAKLESGPLTPELEAEVTKILDDLEFLTNPEVASRVNAGAAAEAQAAGLPPVGAGDTGLKVEGADAGPLPDAALERLRQLPGAHKWLTGRPEHDVRMVIQTLDSALGEVNDLTAVGTRASRQASREEAEKVGSRFRAVGEEEAEREAMVQSMGEVPVAQADEGMADIARLQEAEETDLAVARDLRGFESQTAMDDQFPRLEMEEDIELEGIELQEFDEVEFSVNPDDWRELDEYLSGQSMENALDARPVTQATREGRVAHMTTTPQDTALNYVVAQLDKGWQGYDPKGAARLMSQLHGITKQEAFKLIRQAENAAQDPTTKVYAKVANATNQAPEKTVVDVAMAMNPFPESVVVDEVGKPKALFHGGPRAFDKMSDKYLGSGAGTNRYGKGHHFSDTELAGEYASKGEGGNIRKAYLDIRNPVDMDAPPSDQMMEVLEAEGRAFDVDPDDTMKDVYDRWIVDLTDEQGMELGAAKDYISAKFEEAGFDGLTYKFGDLGRGNDHEVWVAFHARQVRNAFGGLQGAAEEIATEQAKIASRTPSQAAQALPDEIESGQVGIEDAVAQIVAAGKRGKLSREKAAKLLQKALKLHDSPIVQAIANHPAVIEVAGAGALKLAMLWGMDHIKFDGGDDDVSRIGKVL